VKIVRRVAMGDGNLLTSNVAQTDYAPWDATTPYVAGDRVIYVASNIHNVYEAAASTTGDDPYYSTVTPAKWGLVGSTNRWKIFDGMLTSQTVNGGSIDVTLYPIEPIDTVALLNSSAVSARIVVTDASAGTVYDQTHSLVDPAGVQDWYAYFYEPTGRAADFVVTDIPRYANAAVRIVLSSPDYARCGEVVLGRAKDIGYTSYGASVGVQDYSIKQQNAWGDYEIVERPYAKRGEFRIEMPNAGVDALQAMLAAYRSEPVLYIGSEEFGSTLLYGFYKDFAVDIAYPSFSVCTLSVEGLT
jgi:hypothetical protein